jgi:predicted RNA methylase
MNSETLSPNIKERSTLLLSNSLDPVEAEKIIKEVYEYFSEVTTITGFDMDVKHLAAVPTARGMALSLNYAAQCLLDYRRTAKFIQGIVAAIQEKQRSHPGQVIRIFYAGCGPYAPFVTFIAPLFRPEEIQFSLLEINEESLESAKKLIEALDQRGYINEYYLADAVTFEIPSPDSFQILISETLDAVLYRECYVPILFNLLPQLSEQITVIPENVHLNLSFLVDCDNDNEVREEDHHCFKERIVDVRRAVACHNPHSDNLPSTLPTEQFKLEPKARYKGMIIDTDVHIYDKLWLHRGESSLTVACEIAMQSSAEYNNVNFTYHLEPQVELKFEFQ